MACRPRTYPLRPVTFPPGILFQPTDSTVRSCYYCGVLVCRNRESEIRDGCDQLAQVLFRALDVNFDKFEMYTMKNLFKVPDAVAARIEAGDASLPSSASAFPSASSTSLSVGSSDEEAAAVNSRIEALQTEIIMVRAAAALCARHCQACFPLLSSAIVVRCSVLT